MMRRCLSLVFATALVLTGEERAQVSGVVRDVSNSVLTAAFITIVNQDTGIRRSTESDAIGHYVVAGLPAGLYKITVRKPGFQTIAHLNVRLTPAQSSLVDFTMQVGSMREVITIQDSPPLINADDASIGATVGRDFIEKLPLNGGELLGIVGLMPGVVATPATLGEAGQFTANGQRPNANYFTVDGVSANTGVSGSVTPAQFSGGTLPAMTAFGTTQTLSPAEDVQEVHVQTSTFVPEFGRAPGANVAIVSRAGTNEMHGSVFYVGRNSMLAANDWFANAAGLARAPASLNNWGAAFGGPLHRDRTFFFVHYEGLRLMQPFAWRSAVPSLASREVAPLLLRPVLAAFPRPNGPALGGGLSELVSIVSRPSRMDLGGIRIDHALTSRISAFGRYQKVPSNTESGYAEVDRSQFNNDSFTIGVSALAGPNITSDLRLSLLRTNVASRWISTGAGGAAPVDLSFLFPKPVPSGALLYGFAIGGIGQLLSGEAGRSRQNQWNAIETLAWNNSSHAVRFGVDYNRLSPTRDSVASIVSGTYARLSDLLENRFMLISSSHADRASSLVEALALFAQDTWRITKQLTVTYGVRWELTPAPSYRFSPPGVPAFPVATPPPGGIAGSAYAVPSLPIWPSRYNQFAPRVGVAYKIGAGTVLRAGWGMFYDVNFGVATDPINAFPYNRWQFGSVSPTSPVAALNPFDSGYGYAPNLKLPYAREWNVSLEHAFGESGVASVSYVGSATRRLLRREATLAPDAQLALTPIATNNGRANFESLQLQYRRKLSSGFQGLAAYTWSHSIDNGSWDSGIYSPLIHAADDRGSSSFDVRQNFSAGMAWSTPRFRQSSLLETLSRNWTLSTLIAARSAFPIDVLASENILGLGFDDFKRPDLVPGISVWIEDARIPHSRRLNPAAFSILSGGRQGNLGRNSIAGFGLGQIDVALGREFGVREESIFSLRIEAFNLLNTPRFADPVRFLNSPLFGQSASMLNLMLGSGTPHSGMPPGFLAGGPRVLQITARFRF